MVLLAGAQLAQSASAGYSAPALLRMLSVSYELPAGYDREKFNHWTTVPGKGCDTRQFVLFRQDKKRPRGCGDSAGKWFSLYDGKTVSSSSTLDVDHMVPLAEAWASGARSWSPQQRELFANDLYTFSLVAVTLSSNRSKGDSDPAEWLPPQRGFVCSYLARWTAVKYRWRLSIDAREQTVIKRRFQSCPSSTLRLPTIKQAKVPNTPGGGGGEKADPRFDTCTDATTAGYGPYVKDIDPEYWWYEDRDGDGTVCE